jgi:hypothetical protein
MAGTPGPLPAKGKTIKFSNLKAEYEGDGTISMSEYYRGGPDRYVRPSNNKGGQVAGLSLNYLLFSTGQGNGAKDWKHFYITDQGDTGSLLQGEDLIASFALFAGGYTPTWFAYYGFEGYKSYYGGTTMGQTAARKGSGTYANPWFDYNRSGSGFDFQANGDTRESLGFTGSWIESGYPQKNITYAYLSINGFDSDPINKTVPDYSRSSNSIIKMSNFALQDNDGYSDGDYVKFEEDFLAKWSPYVG